MHFSSSSADSELSEYSLTTEELRKGYRLFLGRKPRSKTEIRKAIGAYRTVSGMNDALLHSREFNSTLCKIRLKLKRATPELFNIAYELLLRRPVESEGLAMLRARKVNSQLKLVKDIIRSEEALQQADRFRMLSKPALNASPKTIFLHIPKTAGSSFYKLATSIYSERASFNTTGEIPEQGFAGANIIGGHFSYSTYEQMTGQRVFLALVRDPVERAVSNFNFYKNEEQGREQRISENFDHEDMKKTLRESPFRKGFIHNIQCRYLSGRPAFSSVKSAFKRDVFIVGHFQNLSSWLTIVGERLGWPTVELPRKNVASNPDYLEQFQSDAELIDILRTQNEEDFALSEFIMQNGVYESQGPGFDYSPFRI